MVLIEALKRIDAKARELDAFKLQLPGIDLLYSRPLQHHLLLLLLLHHYHQTCSHHGHHRRDRNSSDLQRITTNPTMALPLHHLHPPKHTNPRPPKNSRISYPRHRHHHFPQKHCTINISSRNLRAECPRAPHSRSRSYPSSRHRGHRPQQMEPGRSH